MSAPYALSISCRLCGGQASSHFRARLLDKYEVGYFACKTCGCLQTEQPYWLAEAYAEERHYLDTGAALHVQLSQYLVFLIVKIFRLRRTEKLLDWGGGDGLLARMLRDAGLDAYSFDKYAINSYASGFDDDGRQHYGIITAFELLEHLVDVRAELEQMFARQPDVVMFSTEQWRGQGPDWSYRVPEGGQHVFFYSERTMCWIGKHFGYDVRPGFKYTIFSRKYWQGA